MKVSRSYINTKEIVNFPVNERFFALDIQNLLDLEQIEPNEPQIAIVNAVNDPRHRFVTACISRRVGKSFIAYTMGFLKLLEPNTEVLIVAPNYSLANIGWEHSKRLIKKYGLTMEKENAKDKEIQLSNGSLLKLASANQADSALGRSYDFIIFEEAAISSKGGDAFQVQLMPTLDKPNSKALFISTPRGKNWFKSFYDEGYKTKESSLKWVSIHATYRDNPRVSLETIEDARERTSPAKFAQEYEADFGVFEGQIYDTFDFTKHVRDLSGMYNFFKDRDQFDVIMGIDVGYRDPTAILTALYNFDQDVFYIIREYQFAQRTTSEHAEYIHQIEEELNGIDYVFVDSAAAQFRHDLAMEHDISTKGSKKSVNDGISYVQDLFWKDKVIIDERCTDLILALENYRWYMPETDGDSTVNREKPVHDEHSHISDALRYLLYSISR